LLDGVGGDKKVPKVLAMTFVNVPQWEIVKKSYILTNFFYKKRKKQFCLKI
jgi:hypothetical protein